MQSPLIPFLETAERELKTALKKVADGVSPEDAAKGVKSLIVKGGEVCIDFELVRKGAKALDVLTNGGTEPPKGRTTWIGAFLQAKDQAYRHGGRMPERIEVGDNAHFWPRMDRRIRHVEFFEPAYVAQRAFSEIVDMLPETVEEAMYLHRCAIDSMIFRNGGPDEVHESVVEKTQRMARLYSGCYAIHRLSR